MGRRALLIGHRGASGYRPEHTLEAYALAARLGADVIEPDLVPTADGVLVARHESEISQTTDVAGHPELAGRRTSKEVDGATQTGWFTEDLTLAELRTLRARERLPELRPQNTAWDGRLAIPTFAEILALAAELAAELGRPIGVYPETKHPAHFRALGLPLEERLADALADAPAVPVRLQSFAPDSLRRLAALCDAPRAQLVAPGDPCDPAAIAAYAQAVAPAKELLDVAFVDAAHAAGLEVHAWTFRAENAFLPPALRSSDDPAAHGDLAAELTAALALGVDAVFCDHPDIAAAVIGPR